MSFTLRLHISGLGLFAHGDGAMHVLLPSTHGHHEHTARVWFDSARYHPGAGQDWVPFDGVRWILPLGRTPSLNTNLPASLVDVSKYTTNKKKLEKDQLRHDDQFNVEGHVVLRDGKAVCAGESATWRFGNSPPFQMTNRVVWEIPDIAGDILRFDFQALRVKTPPATPVDYLTQSEGLIEIHLLYAPDEEHENPGGDSICEPSAGSHFKSYFHLFRGETPRKPDCQPAPVSDATCPPPGFPKSRDKSAPFPGTRIYTCMLATSEVE